MIYCEGAKLSLFVFLLAQLLGLGQALLKIYSDQTWQISLWLCIVLCVSKVLIYSRLGPEPVFCHFCASQRMFAININLHKSNHFDIWILFPLIL